MQSDFLDLPSPLEQIARPTWNGFSKGAEAVLPKGRRLRSGSEGKMDSDSGKSPGRAGPILSPAAKAESTKVHNLNLIN